MLVENESSPKAPKENGNKQHKDPKKHDKDDDSPSQYNIESKSSSREEKSRRKSDQCAYCKKIGHDEHKCFHKNIDDLTQILQTNNI